MSMNWFHDAAFGTFIHWGLYAVPGGIWKGQETDYIGEWLQARMRIPNTEYSELTKQFDPQGFNADEWVRLFAEAGMKYIVFTAKHHEGFSMFRTAVSPYNIVEATPFKRDPLKELAGACKKYGLKLGIYYSHCLDWHEKDAADPGRDSTNIDGSSWGNDWDFPDRNKKDFNHYFRTKVIPQVRELLTNYGPVGVIWFDCATGITKEQCEELRDLVHRLQPDCLINGRIGHGCQDYVSLGDNQMPGSAIPGLVECPATLNDTWGFKWNDHHWKKPEEIISMLLSLAEKKVTFLLNVGPRPDGKLTQETIDILSRIGTWRRKNGEALYRTDGTPFPQHVDGVFILRDQKKLHFFPEQGVGTMTFSGIHAKVISCPLPCRQDEQTLSLDFSGLTESFPDICVEFDAVPEVDRCLMPQNGILNLPVSLGTVHPGDNDALSAADTQDTDGNKIETASHMYLSDTGILYSWHNPTDRMEWEISITDPGNYDVFATTRSGQHSFPWTGEREIEISANGQIIRAELIPHGNTWDQYYPTAESLIGTISFEKQARVKIAIRTTAIHAQNALMMTLTAISLRKK